MTSPRVVGSPAAISHLEPIVAAGRGLSRAEAGQLVACPDLVAIGSLGELARKARHGSQVTFGRVCLVPAGPLPATRAQAGEVRLTGRPASADEARARVRAAAPLAAGATFTGFSLADLLDVVSWDHLALASLGAALRADGLDAIADVPLDRLGEPDNAVEVVRAVTHGGLGAWRATNDSWDASRAIDWAERAALVQRETRALRTAAPLPRTFAPESPSTGYDDVRTVTVTRLVCRDVPSIQVDWSLYGPKLAQVAIVFGADDLDGVDPVDDLSLGPRRAPAEDVRRQIRAAGADPCERNGRFEPLS